jgi:hypothetical protein
MVGNKNSFLSLEFILSPIRVLKLLTLPPSTAKKTSSFLSGLAGSSLSSIYTLVGQVLNKTMQIACNITFDRFGSPESNEGNILDCFVNQLIVIVSHPLAYRNHFSGIQIKSYRNRFLAN